MTFRKLTLLGMLAAALLPRPAAAQTCSESYFVDQKVVVEHPSCAVAFNDAQGRAYRCDPDANVRLSAWVAKNEPNLPYCRPFEWTFNDGSPKATTTEPVIEHTFPVGHRQVSITEEPLPASFADSARTRIYSYYGTFGFRGAYPGNTREGNGNVILTVGRFDARFPATVDFAVTESGPHRIIPMSGTLSYATGEQDKTIEIVVLDDDVFTNFPTLVTFTMTNATGGYGFYTDYGVKREFSIDDDDYPTSYRFVSRGLSVNESAGSVGVEIERSGDVTKATSGKLVIRPEPIYWAEPEKAFTFAPGETRKTVPLLVQDGYYNGLRTTVLSCFADSGIGLSEFDPIPFEVADDEPAPAVVSETLEISEAYSSPQITIEPPFADIGRVKMTDMKTGTATDPADYTTFHDEVICRGRARNGDLHIHVVDDALVEADETVQYMATAAGRTSGPITVRILDNDGNWSIVPEQSTVTAGPLALRISAGKPVSEALVIPLVSSDPAIVSVPASVTIPAGASDAPFEADARERGSAAISTGITFGADAEQHRERLRDLQPMDQSAVSADRRGQDRVDRSRHRAADR